MTREAEPTETGSDEELLGTLRVGELALKAVGVLIVLMGMLATLAYFAHDPVVALAERFVAVLGAPGIGLGFFLPDAFTLPIPNDAFSFFGLVGGIPFWTCCLWASIGTLLGGSTGYLIGQRLSDTRVFHKLMARKGREVRLLVDRYGVIALLSAAITPIPYSIACWSAGACGIKFSTFFLVSLSRVPRVIFYLWLMEQGFMNFAASL